MASASTALERVREICLSLPETSEGTHVGALCFRAGRRMFATCGEKDGVCVMVVQLESDHASLLVENDPRFQRYPRQKDCVLMDVTGVTDWSEVRELVLESYRLNAPAKKTRGAAPRKKAAKKKVARKASPPKRAGRKKKA
jgi:hypothetical protein